MTPESPLKKTGWNPWPWSIIAFFAMLVPAVVAYAVFASHQSMDLVQKDYYEEELRFQRQIDATERANASAKPAAVAFDAPSGRLTVSVPLQAGVAGTAASLKLYRPSDASLDRTLPLLLGASGSQQVDLRDLKPGLWRVRLSWRVGNDDYYHADSLVIPQRP